MWRARAALVDGLVAGEPPGWSDPDPAAVARDTLAWWGAHANVAGVAWLVGRMQEYIHADEGELAELRGLVDGATAYALIDGDRAGVERYLRLGDRIAARTAAMEGFHAEFKARVGAWLKKHRGAVESGLYECLALEGIQGFDNHQTRKSG